MAAENLVTFSDANFQKDVLESDKLVLVDFWAPWCQPCLRLGPTIDALATEFAGRMTVGKLNTDDNQQTPSSYSISGIPTVMLFKGGQMVEKLVGLVPRDKLVAAINNHI